MIRLQISTLIGVLIGVLILATALQVASADESWERDAETAYRTSRTTKRPLILYVTMNECFYCRKMEHDTFANKDVRGSIKDKFVAASVKAETRNDLVKWFKVRSFPTTIIVSPDGKVIDYIRGYIGPEDMRQRLDAALSKSMALRR